MDRGRYLPWREEGGEAGSPLGFLTYRDLVERPGMGQPGRQEELEVSIRSQKPGE